MLHINKNEKLCYLDNKPLDLSKSEYNLIEYLSDNPNKIFSREELLQTVWKKSVTVRTVDVTVTRLRKKLGDSSNCIVTRSGFGYGFFN